MKVLVTGASGFIGAILTEKLISDGFTVNVMTRHPHKILYPNIQIHEYDLLANHSPSLLARIVDDCDAIIHCAGEVRDVKKMYALHVEGTRKLLEAFKASAISNGITKHWVQLSSVGAYGQSAVPGIRRDVTEESPLNPVGEYEVTKTLADQLVTESADSHLTYSILRPSNVVGTTMTNRSFLALLKSIRKGMFFYIGSRESISNYVHADDVCNGLLLCLQHPDAKNNVFNLSNDCNLSEIVSQLALNDEVAPILKCVPELPLRLLAKLFSLTSLWPLTKSRIDALVSKTRYPTEKLRKLGFKTTIDIPEFSVAYLNHKQQEVFDDIHHLPS